LKTSKATRTTTVLLAAVVLTGAATGIGAMTAMSAPTGQSTDWSEVLSVFDQQQRGTDVPEALRTSETIDPSTVRQIGTSADFYYYTAINNLDEVCLAIASHDETGSIGYSCSDIDVFSQHGVGMQVVSLTAVTRAYLVPDTAIEAAARTTTADAGENLVIVDPYAVDSAKSRVLDTAAGDVELRPFGEPNVDEVRGAE
jgi:hypothetical protein